MKSLIARIFSVVAKNNAAAESSNEKVIDVLDQTAEDFQFPMLDNGYIYPAASRLSLYANDVDWALVFETFGYSPRAGFPDLSISTISNKLVRRNPPENFVSEKAYEKYLLNNSHFDLRLFHPITNEDWVNEEEPEFVKPVGSIVVRNKEINLPNLSEYKKAGIEPKETQLAVFELCRYLGETHRQYVLGTEAERRVSVCDSLSEILVLNDWHHPDLASGQKPSETETFRQLADVLQSNESWCYSTCEKPNSHWSNWPGGGLL